MRQNGTGHKYAKSHYARQARNVNLHFSVGVGKMPLWRFWDYLTEDHESPFQDWYGSQDYAVQAALDETVLVLRGADDWLDPAIKQFSKLTGRHAGLSELRFWVQRPRGKPRKLRAAGLFRPASREFVFLVGCEKTMGGLIYIPPDAFGMALKYKRDFEAGKGAVREHI